MGYGDSREVNLLSLNSSLTWEVGPQLLPEIVSSVRECL